MLIVEPNGLFPRSCPLEQTKVVYLQETLNFRESIQFGMMKVSEIDKVCPDLKITWHHFSIFSSAMIVALFIT